jgi:hypothetical protein
MLGTLTTKLRAGQSPQLLIDEGNQSIDAMGFSMGGGII